MRGQVALASFSRVARPGNGAPVPRAYAQLGQRMDSQLKFLFGATGKEGATAEGYVKV
jgi:hypothetical protein